MNLESLTRFLNDEFADAPIVRNNPRQSRSRQSLEKILRVAGEIIDETGHAGVTTAEVAKRADVAIGTVYRFYPDRIALLLGVYDYMIDRHVRIALEAFQASPAGDWREALRMLLDSTIVARRTIPGYRAAHYRILADGSHVERYRERSDAYVEAVLGLLSPYGIPQGDAWRRRMSVAIEMSVSIVRLAFDEDPDGDPSLLAEAERVALGYVAEGLGE